MDIQDLIEKHGNQSGLAKHFGVTRQYVSKWVAAGKIPEKYLLREAAPGGDSGTRGR
jgi:hypothetical protein